MNSSYYSSSSTFFYLSQNDQNAPSQDKNTISIPIDSPSSGETSIPIPVRLPGPDPSAAAATAAKIQSAYRSHLVRRLVRRIMAVDSEADHFERLIQRQETVDAVRRDHRERVLVGEGLMSLLLRLDSVPGIYPEVRELRRNVSRRIVGLQEVMDAIVEARVEGFDGFPGSWEEMVVGMRGEEEEEMGGDVRGFECLEKFLLGV